LYIFFGASPLNSMSRFGTNWQKLHADTDRDLRSFYPKWYWRLSQSERTEAHLQADQLGSIYRDPVHGAISNKEAEELMSEYYGWGRPPNRYNGYDALNWKSAWQADRLDEFGLWHQAWEKKAGMHTKTVVIT